MQWQVAPMPKPKPQFSLQAFEGLVQRQDRLRQNLRSRRQEVLTELQRIEQHLLELGEDLTPARAQADTHQRPPGHGLKESRR